MRRKLLFLFALISIVQITYSQCPVSSFIFLSDQQDVEDFATNYPNCSEIPASKTIRISGTVTDLSSLSFITKINGTLSISNADNLSNVNGLNNLTHIGHLDINNNLILNDLSGFDNVIEIVSLRLYRNDALTNLSFLNNISQIQEFVEIERMDALTSINFLTNLTSIGNYLEILNNENLIDIDGFNNLLSVGGYIHIKDNDVLNQVNGFNQLQSLVGDLNIENNPILTSVTNFVSLPSIIGNFELVNNINLQTLNGFANLSTINGNFLIENCHSLTGNLDFDSLQNIQGNFTLTNNNGLINFQGLENLQTVGNLSVSHNNSLLNFVGLSNLQNTGNFHVQNNDNLNNLNGLNNISSISGLSITQNDNLLQIDDLSSITVLNSCVIQNNNSLLNLNGLDNIQTVNGDLLIGSTLFSSGNPSLISANFNSLLNVVGTIAIVGNGNLQDLSGFGLLQNVGSDIEIRANGQLSTISGFNSLTTVGATIEISNNDILTEISGFNNLLDIGFNLIIAGHNSLQAVSGFQNLTIIENFLQIEGNDNLTSIAGFQSLTTINDDLRIGARLIGEDTNTIEDGNISLPNLEGLNSLTSIGGDLFICENLNLQNIDALSNITSIGGRLVVYGDFYVDTLLQNIHFPLLESVESIFIQFNSGLISLAFSSLNGVNDQLKIRNNSSLTNLIGLETITGVGDLLIIQQNDALTNLQGLNGLETIGEFRLIGNSALTDISQLSNADHNSLNFLSIYGNDNLSVCSIPFVCNYLSINYGNTNIYNNNINCNTENEIFQNCSTGLNTIVGILTSDLDANGCDTQDNILSNFMITVDNGVQSSSTFTDANGAYQLFISDGSYSVSVNSIPSYFSVTPDTFTSSFTDFGNTNTVDFCVTPNTTVNDAIVSVYPSIDDPRPGFDTTYQIVYKNIGTTQLNGDVTFEFDSTKIQFLNASETISSQTGNTLTFNYSNLNPFETRTIDLEFNVFAPPTTNIDDILVSTATINPISGDNTEEDNVFELEQTVIGSYDPNDISVLEGEEILIEDADKYLHYLIRFQNTGTASAINVNVENVLDTNLDWTTMQLESLSHTGRVEITDGNMVKFIFEDINLPDSTSDEPNSHGFIAYKIKPKNTVVIGDIVYNTADIFFDFNPAITTNTVATEIVEPLSVGEFEINKFSIYPNPTKDIIHVNGKEKIKKLSIIDLNSKLLNEIDYTNSQTNAEISMSDYAIGLYFLSIETDKGTYTHKIIKQ